MPPSPTRRRHSSARRLFQKQQDDLFARANSLAVLCMLDNPDNEPEDHEMTLGLLNAALSYVRQANEPRTEPTTEEIRANRQPPFVWDNAEAWLKVQHEADVIGDFRFQKEGLLKLRQNLNLPAGADQRWLRSRWPLRTACAASTAVARRSDPAAVP